MRHVLAAVTVIAAAVSACASAPAVPDADPEGAVTVKPVAWGPCTDIKRPQGATPAQEDTTVRCGKVTVPLDYSKPNGDTIDLALIKLSATHPNKRIGSLVFNFGGPGASGVDTLDQAAKAFGVLRTRYDLISFDPRGVQRSAGVRCGTDAEMETYAALNTLPINAETRAKGKAANQQFAQHCERDAGKVLPYVGTANAARDMDRIRAAVGDPKLNYFGMSYGTQLGAVYATEYPENVGRMVLDAPLDPTVDFEQRALAQTRGFQQAYESFLRWCVKEGCALGANAKAADDNIEKLLHQLAAKSLPVNGRQLTQGLASTAIAAALYSDLTWPFLETALAHAVNGKGGGLMYLADTYTGRNPDGTYSTQLSSFPAITCVDSTERPDEALLRRTEATALKISPMFGSEGPGGLCRFWPAGGSDQARHVDATGSKPIVVVGGKGDPATPYQWAPRLTAQLKTATLVTYEGEGHGAYTSGNKCVTGVVNAYLLNGKVPVKGTTCAAA
ncbi:alpha/beta hydrolase [Nonomuraea sp. NPDC000554]|uniref:alpha/beta hydrolase n=1 Tax=Nonomuraea sp. NPDC000554 TaxID=3154259 RepID=UPI0033241086